MAQFQKGNIPWNKGGKGIRLSVAGEFKKGHVATNKKAWITKYCLKCMKNFSVKPSLDRVRHCSQRCARLGVPSPMKGRKASEETRKKQSLAKIGFRGEKHWNWKGGAVKRSLTKRMRQWNEWKEWRSSVFSRDNFSCKKCGATKVYLEPHHIVPLKVSIISAFDVTNGITLCRPCHVKTMGKEAEYERELLSLLDKSVGLLQTM